MEAVLAEALEGFRGVQRFAIVRGVEDIEVDTYFEVGRSYSLVAKFIDK